MVGHDKMIRAMRASGTDHSKSPTGGAVKEQRAEH